MKKSTKSLLIGGGVGLAAGAAAAWFLKGAKPSPPTAGCSCEGCAALGYVVPRVVSRGVR